VKEELRATTERSVARGAFGSPTFFVGDEIFFGKTSCATSKSDLGKPLAGAGREG